MSAVTMQSENTELRITVGVKLTAADVPAIQTQLKQEISSGVRNMVFDMKETASLDSTGIGLLVAANNSLTAAKGSLRIVNVSSDIFKLLQSMRLAGRLNASTEDREVQHGR